MDKLDLQKYPAYGNLYALLTGNISYVDYFKTLDSSVLIPKEVPIRLLKELIECSGWTNLDLDLSNFIGDSKILYPYLNREGALKILPTLDPSKRFILRNNYVIDEACEVYTGPKIINNQDIGRGIALDLHQNDFKPFNGVVSNLGSFTFAEIFDIGFRKFSRSIILEQIQKPELDPRLRQVKNINKYDIKPEEYLNDITGWFSKQEHIRDLKGHINIDLDSHPNLKGDVRKIFNRLNTKSALKVINRFKTDDPRMFDHPSLEVFNEARKLYTGKKIISRVNLKNHQVEVLEDFDKTGVLISELFGYSVERLMKLGFTRFSKKIRNEHSNLFPPRQS